MSQKTSIWIGMTIGTMLGGMIPSLWDAGLFSISGVLLSGLGGFIGIYVGYKMS